MKKGFILGFAAILIQSSPAFATCNGPQNPTDDLVSQALVNQSSSISQKVPLAPDELDHVKAHIREMREQSAQLAALADSKVDCNGEKLSQLDCAKMQLARAQLQENEAQGSSKHLEHLKDEIAQLEMAKAGSEQLTQTANFLQPRADQNDFSIPKHMTIIAKGAWDSLPELIKPGTLIFQGIGVGLWQLAKHTPIDSTSDAFYKAHGTSNVGTTISDQFGYAYPVLGPLFAVAALTKNNKMMKTFDEAAVGTVLAQVDYVQVGKYAAGDWRPNHTSTQGFPSGHAAETMVLARSLDHNYPGHHHIVGIVSYMTAGGVMMCRLLEGNHDPGQLAAGAFDGYAVAGASIAGTERAASDVLGSKQSTFQNAEQLSVRIPKTKTLLHFVPMGTGGQVNATW